MTDTVEERIVAAVKTRLDQIADTTMYRDRGRPVSDDKVPALNLLVRGDAEPVDYEVATGVEQHVLALAVVGYVKATTDEAASIAHTAQRGQIRRAVGEDPTWGGLAIDTHEIEADVELPDDDGAPRGAALVAISVTYWTKAGDPYSLGP